MVKEIINNCDSILQINALKTKPAKESSGIVRFYILYRVLIPVHQV